MTVKEAPDRESGVATVEYAIAKFQCTAHQRGGAVVASHALAPEPCRVVSLCEQHIIDSIDLDACKVMIVQKPAEIVDVVPSLQLATGIDQVMAGEITGMPVTGSTTVVPQPMQVYTGSPDCRHRQHCRKHNDTYFLNETNGQHKMPPTLNLPNIAGMLKYHRMTQHQGKGRNKALRGFAARYPTES